MYDPPAGYDDFLGDAELVPARGDHRPREVETVGEVLLRRPLPSAAAALAMAGNPKLSMVDRSAYLSLFVESHLDEGEHERLLSSMISGELPDDTFERISRSLATWGTARPYAAVITLSVITAHHWRAMRLRFYQAGITDPLGLPTMHALLDMSESVILESMVSTDQKKDERDRKNFIDKLYAPEPTTAALNGESYVATPAGFEDEDVEAAFDAFTSSAAR